MLGLQWQTGERIGAVQAGLVGEMIDEIREHMESSLRYLFDLRQLIVNRVFDYTLTWEAPSLMDAAEQAKADLLEAQADGARLKVEERKWTLGINSPEDVARAMRPELAGKDDAEVRSALPLLLASPPLPVMEPGAPFGDEPAGSTSNGNGQSRSLDGGFYNSKLWGGNGRH